MIDNNTNIRCPWCGRKSTLKEWDDLTYSQCTNREMKRAYTRLNNEKAFLYKSDTFYMCPRCKKWNRGNNLKLVDK